MGLPFPNLKDYRVLRIIYLHHLSGKKMKITHTPSGAVYFDLRGDLPSRYDKLVISAHGAWIIK